MYKTKILKVKQKLIKENKIKKIKDTEAIKTAAEYILNNQLVAFPTETVYGLGANALESEAVNKIFVAKGRPADNPLIVHISNKRQLFKIVKQPISESAHKLIDTFWPGPLTLIFNKRERIPGLTTADLSTVAVRMPSHPVALALIGATELALAAPSANSSGFPSPTQAVHVYNDLNGKIPLIIDGGICNIGVESTVIEIKENKIDILRPGAVTKEMISEVLKDCSTINLVSESEENKPKSPGMKYKHYAPNTPLWIFNKAKLKSLLKDSKINNKNTAIVATTQTAVHLKNKDIKAELIDMGSKDNLAKIAYSLFSILRDLDLREFNLVLIEEVPSKGIGEAIMNRLKKAAIKII
ncbi:MAG: threonylcarbamoyl-AMP synthase [Halanaerobiales bacterium]|nr:threonylcarbamoyl-AMP synthase [Halanaerobiales bacterium]